MSSEHGRRRSSRRRISGGVRWGAIRDACGRRGAASGQWQQREDWLVLAAGKEGEMNGLGRVDDEAKRFLRVILGVGGSVPA